MFLPNHHHRPAYPKLPARSRHDLRGMGKAPLAGKTATVRHSGVQKRLHARLAIQPPRQEPAVQPSALVADARRDKFDHLPGEGKVGPCAMLCTPCRQYSMVQV